MSVRVTPLLVNTRPFAVALRRLGFTLKFRDGRGGQRVSVYTKDVGGDRVLEAQLWAMGGQRVTHSIRGCYTTHPTAFDSLDSLAKAVEHEAARTDNKYLTAK